MIIASAIKVNKDGKEFVIVGKRHNNCYQTMMDAGVKRPFEEVQGFINDKFEFINRRAAYQHAIDCKQINDTGCFSVLFSEDVFPPEDGSYV